MKVDTKIVKQYLEKYPNMLSQHLAQKIYNEHPKMFRTLNQVRGKVRYYRGRNGKRNRSQIKDKRFILPEPTKNNPYSLPEDWNDLWEPYNITDNAVVILNDIHIPFQDNQALTIVFDYLKTVDFNSILLNGDIWDCFSISKWEVNPELRNFPKELQLAKHFLMCLKNTFPDKKIYYKEGNHEYRFKRRLIEKAPDFFGITEFELRILLGLFETNIDWIDNKRIVKIGKLNILHGHEFFGHGIGGIVPAKTLYNKVNGTALCGHWHRSSQYNSKTLGDKYIGCWSVGCLCNLHPEYARINQWNQGFAIVHRNNHNDFMVENKQIVNHQIM